MTATNPNSVTSDNSDSRLPIEAGAITTDRDPRTRRIVEQATKNNGATTTRDIAAESGWTLEETKTHVRRLEEDNFVQQIGGRDRPIVLLTARGESLARGEL